MRVCVARYMLRVRICVCTHVYVCIAMLHTYMHAALPIVYRTIVDRWTDTRTQGQTQAHETELLLYIRFVAEFNPHI